MTPYYVNDDGLFVRIEVFGRNMLNGTLRTRSGRWLCVHPMMRHPGVVDCKRFATHIAQNGTVNNNDDSYHIPLCGPHAAGWRRTPGVIATIELENFGGRIQDMNMDVRKMVWR